MTESLDNKTIIETGLVTAIDKSLASSKVNVIMDSQLLTALMECPRRTDFRFNLDLVSIKGKSNSIECGSILHKYLEVYYLCIINGVSKKDAHAYGMTAAEMYIQGCPHCTNFMPSICGDCGGLGYNASGVTDVIPPGTECSHCQGVGKFDKPTCGHKPNDYPGIRNTPPVSEGYKVGWQFVLETCEEYNKFWINDHWIPLEVEVVKQRIIYEDDEIRILWKAKLDLYADTNQGIYSVDHKTMKQRRRTPRLNNQFMGQCIVTDMRSVMINKVGWQKTLAPQERFLREPVSYTANQLTEWYSTTVPYYAKLLLMYSEQGYFPPNYTSCDGKYGPCAYRDVCEADEGMREDELRNNFIVGPKWDVTNDNNLLTEGDD